MLRLPLELPSVDRRGGHGYVKPYMETQKKAAAAPKKAALHFPATAVTGQKKGLVCIYKDFTGLEMWDTPENAAAFREEQKSK